MPSLCVSNWKTGGTKNSRTSVYSIVARETEAGGGVIFQLYDIQKFFDKENLRDVMDTLHHIGVNPKLYRAWFNLKSTQVSR